MNPTERFLGRWPHSLKQLWWDLVPGKYAPPNSGIEEPDYARPGWLDQLEQSTKAEAIEHAIRAHDQADTRVAAAEEKAARLLNLSLALLGLSFALAGWQVEFARDHGFGIPYLMSLIPVGFSVVFFSISGFSAFAIDGVGIYHQPGVSALSKGTSRLEVEDHGRETASWTARQKLTALLQARAWFSRGLFFLVLAAASAIISLIYPL
jgi:hypothetical protein